MDINYVIEQLIDRLGPATSRDEFGAMWGTRDVLPFAFVQKCMHEYEGVAIFVGAEATATQQYRAMRIAETVVDYAGLIVRGELSGSSIVTPLELAIDVTAMLLGKARINPVRVFNDIVATLGMEYTREASSATWTNGQNSVTVRREPDDTCTVIFRGEDGELTHVIAETTTTPAVIGCATRVDAIYNSGPCTLAVAVSAAKRALAEGPQVDRSIGRFP